jgi:hypothetical protein
MVLAGRCSFASSLFREFSESYGPEVVPAFWAIPIERTAQADLRPHLGEGVGTNRNRPLGPLIAPKNLTPYGVRFRLPHEAA